MIESELQAYLQTHYPRENAACEWKAFRKLGHAVFEGSKRENLDNLRWSRSFGQPPGWNKLRPVPGFWF